jgi:hypothetical protein
VNDYYTSTLTAVPATSIRSSAIKGQFSAVEAGFDEVQVLLRPALKAPTGEIPAAIPAALARANKVLGFDGTGDPMAVTVATEAQVSAALSASVTASEQAALAIAAASAVSSATAAIAAPIVIVTGTTQLAEVGKHYVLVNAALTTVTLPASMVASDAVIVSAMNGRLDNVIARNGHNIMARAENLTLNRPFSKVWLKYADATRGMVRL